MEFCTPYIQQSSQISLKMCATLGRGRTAEQALKVQRAAGRCRESASTCAVPLSSHELSCAILASDGVLSAHGTRSSSGTEAPNSCASSCARHTAFLQNGH